LFYIDENVNQKK